MAFFNELVRYETKLWNALEAALRQGGQSSVATLQALRILADHAGEGRVHDMSTELGITIGAASKLVDRLERDGLAQRRPHPVDRRSSLVALTPAGVRTLAEGEKVAGEALGRLVGEAVDVRVVTEALSRLSGQLTAGATS